MINNSTEQTEITTLLQQNITYNSFWQRFMPTRECILNFKPSRKDVFCFGATTLSILSFSTIGYCLGSLAWAIKTDTAIDFNNVNSISGLFFLLGIGAGFRFGITIGDCFLNLVGNNNEENESLLNNNNGNDSREVLQEIIIIDEDGNQLLFSENDTKTSRLDNGLIKIKQTFKVETKKDEDQQPKHEMNSEDEILSASPSESSNFIQVQAEIHDQSIDFDHQQPSTSKGLAIINL